MSARPVGLVRRIRLAVPVERTFAAVGTLAGVRGWWTPLVHGSAKEGSLLTLRFRGLDETIRFRVEARAAPRTVRWLCLGHDSLTEWAGTRLSFTARAAGPTSSSLELVHEGLVPELECYPSCRAGWQHFLDSLVAWAETGRGSPFGARRSEPGPLGEPAASGHTAFLALASTFARDPRVTPPGAARGRFGGNGFKTRGKVFAMWVRDTLAVKLPSAEIDAAVAEGRGERLTMGRGRVMREWLVVREAERRWSAIAERARAFVDFEDNRSPTARR